MLLKKSMLLYSLFKSKFNKGIIKFNIYIYYINKIIFMVYNMLMCSVLVK